MVYSFIMNWRCLKDEEPHEAVRFSTKQLMVVAAEIVGRLTS
jgi:hypothetical protein